MKIALINENSQAAKNGIIEAALKKVVEPMGHEVVNYGMYAADDAAQLTYVQCGILAAILLNSGAADYVITGCGTGEGAMLALNSFPGVICGHVEDPVDAYTFAHVNDGNAVAMPFAKGFGWGGELNLSTASRSCLASATARLPQGARGARAAQQEDPGRRAPWAFGPLVEILQGIDQDLVKVPLPVRSSASCSASRKDDALAAYIKTLHKARGMTPCEWLYHLNAGATHGLEMETAVPMIAGLAEVIGLFIIITSFQGDLPLCAPPFSTITTTSS